MFRSHVCKVLVLLSSIILRIFAHQHLQLGFLKSVFLITLLILWTDYTKHICMGLYQAFLGRLFRLPRLEHDSLIKFIQELGSCFEGAISLLCAGTSPPGWNPMGMRCRTSAAPEWKAAVGPGLSPLHFASDPLPPLEATLVEHPRAATAAAAPVITGALSERSASGSVTGPSASHFSSVSTSSSLEGW